MIGRLPPVGQRVRWQESPAAPDGMGFHAIALNSGTAALALGIRLALERNAERREVILPAYACPDVVAAAVHAGARPVLVDCSADDPGFDLAALAGACSGATAVVVAVNFLGIRERLAEIGAIAERTGALLIEDCAQWFPEHPPEVPVAARIVSFGRGKPVNLLGGGTLLIDEAGPLAGPIEALPGQMPSLSRLKARLFNRLLDPLPYGLVSQLPGLQLGATRYHALERIEAMDAVRARLMAANVSAWLARSRWREECIGELLEGCASIDLLPRRLGARAGRLLRYPLLCRDREQRDRLLAALQQLGASAFYTVPLPKIEGVREFIAPDTATPGADRFADRLLTLPVHDGVREEHLQAMARVIRAAV